MATYPSGFKICVNAVLKDSKPMPKHAIVCQCVYGSFPEGYITFVRNSSMPSRPVWMMFLELLNNGQSIVDCIDVYMWAFIKASEQVNEAFHWAQHSCECCSKTFTKKNRSISHGMYVYGWAPHMAAEPLYDVIRLLQGSHEHCSKRFKVNVEAFQFDKMDACWFTQWL